MSTTTSHLIHRPARLRRPGRRRPDGAPGGLARFVRGAARASARHPKLAIALWLALIVGCVRRRLDRRHPLAVRRGVGLGQSAHAEARLQRAGLLDSFTENVIVRSSSAVVDR